jgi:hypothetical protein
MYSDIKCKACNIICPSLISLIILLSLWNYLNHTTKSVLQRRRPLTLRVRPRPFLPMRFSVFLTPVPIFCALGCWTFSGFES